MQSPHVVELGGRAERRVDLVGVVEERVIDFVFPGLLAKCDDVLESVAPEYLRRQVGTSGLGRHACRLYHTWNTIDIYSFRWIVRIFDSYENNTFAASLFIDFVISLLHLLWAVFTSDFIMHNLNVALWITFFLFDSDNRRLLIVNSNIQKSSWYSFFKLQKEFLKSLASLYTIFLIQEVFFL